MKKVFLGCILIVTTIPCLSQGYVTYYYDLKNFQAVSENHAMRTSSEAAFINFTDQANKHTSTIKDNLTKYVAVKAIITESLTNVNETLKSGKTVKRIYETVDDIMRNISQLEALAVGNPEYLPFIRNFTRQTYTQSLGVVEDVTKFVHGKDAKNVIMSYQERSALLRKIDTRLCVINGTVISMCKCLEQAKLNSFWWHINPFKDFIEQDKQLIQQIIIRANAL